VTILISLVSFFIVILVLILAHEFGHFITAKASRVKVEEFGLGFPPKLLSTTWHETRYSLNVIPLGGFVKMAGEENPKVPDSLASKGIITRLMVLSAGSLMNLLLPLLLFSIAFMVPHNIVTGQVLIEAVDPDSPAAVAGIEPGDFILSINEKPVGSLADVHRYIQLNLGKEITVLVKHSNGNTEDIRVIPRWKPPEGRGAIGIVAITTNTTTVSQSEPFWRAIPSGVIACIETFVLFKNGIISMIIGATPVVISGPVGIAQITGEVTKAGISPLLEFAAFLSINLAIINMFPLPALDGGRITFILIEGVRQGKRIAPKTEALIHTIGFVLLIIAFLAITYQDITRIISGNNPIP